MTVIVFEFIENYNHENGYIQIIIILILILYNERKSLKTVKVHKKKKC